MLYWQPLMIIALLLKSGTTTAITILSCTSLIPCLLVWRLLLEMCKVVLHRQQHLLPRKTVLRQLWSSIVSTVGSMNLRRSTTRTSMLELPGNWYCSIKLTNRTMIWNSQNLISKLFLLQLAHLQQVQLSRRVGANQRNRNPGRGRRPLRTPPRWTRPCTAWPGNELQLNR